MPFNGSGSFSPPGANYPAVSGTTATAANRNAVDADFASGLSNAITKDGQTTVTANIPLGANKITGLAAGTAATDATNVANLQNGTGTYVATVGGTADVITLTASPAITAYAAGQRFSFIASGANTTNVTVNISALGAKAVTKKGATALVAGDISSGGMVVIEYDGTQFQAVGLAGILDEDDMASDSATLPPSQQSVKAYVDAGDVDIVLATPQPTTSGTSIDFTGIPAGVKKIVVSFVGVSTTSTDPILVQLGDAGGLETSVYTSGSSEIIGASTTQAQSSSGFTIPAGASQPLHGTLTINLENSSAFTWVSSGVLHKNAATSFPMIITAGSKSLSAVLTQVSLTTATGFTAGEANISYE